MIILCQTDIYIYILCLANGLVLYSFYYCLINDYCLIIDRRTQVLFFIFLLTLTSDRRGLSIFALKMTLAGVGNTAAGQLTKEVITSIKWFESHFHRT